MTLLWTANELLTGWGFTSRLPIVAQKSGRQSFTSTTSDQSDADLRVDLPDLAATYEVHANYAVSGPVAADITLEWTATGDATVVRTMQALGLATNSATDTEIVCRELSTDGWAAGTTTPTQSTVRETLLVTTDALPCSLWLVWHQNASNATATSIHAYSWAVAQRIA